MPFTASIIQRDFTTVFDNALKLGGASYLRALAYGGGWSRIRIGALVAVTPNSTINISDAVLTIGLCSGKNYPGSSNCTLSAFGFSCIGSPVQGSTRLLTYTANSGYPYFNPTTGVIFRKTCPIGYQVSASAGAFFLPLAGTGTQKRRFPIYVDITRSLGGAGLATVNAYGVTVAATGQLDFRPDHFQDGLDQIGTPTIYNTALTAGATISTISIGDEFGPLDTFEIFWSNSTFPLEIYAIGAVVINPTQNSGTLDVYTDTGGGFDILSQYQPGTQVTDLAFGTGFSGAGTIYGASYGTTVINMLGTSGGVPMENFEQYTTGSIVSGVTLNAGTGWSNYGTIY